MAVDFGLADLVKIMMKMVIVIVIVTLAGDGYVTFPGGPSDWRGCRHAAAKAHTDLVHKGDARGGRGPLQLCCVRNSLVTVAGCALHKELG